VGKSATAVFLAQRYGGEIIACDSMQVYRGFDIGTDKPTPAQRRAVIHHLLDLVEPSIQFTAADFVREALAAIRLIEVGGRVPFVVGGTGLYLKALLEGLFPGPGKNESLRARLEESARAESIERLYERLETVDPVYARLIGRRDKTRIIRALEVFELTQKPISQHFPGTRSAVAGFHLLKIGLKLERQELYRRIEKRVDRMFHRGLVQEVESLLRRGVAADSPPFRALGYRHVLRHLRKEITLEEAVERTKADTRHYARRQLTWFRKTAGVIWFAAEDKAALSAAVEAHLAS
jgi:tRNA dimethylallyltransferase